MKRLIPCMLAALLLLGCAGAPHETEPSRPPETAAAPTETTAAPETLPTQPEKSKVEQLMERMTLEEKVGQLFLARCRMESAAEDIENYHLGGLVLFGQDFREETRESMRVKLAQYQQAARLPLFLAVDEEGGTVCRVSA